MESVKLKLEEYDWEMLYSKTEEYLHNNGIKTFSICRNMKTLFGCTAIVTINIQQKGNKKEIEWLRNNAHCFQSRGTNIDGKRMYQFYVRASEI